MKILPFLFFLVTLSAWGQDIHTTTRNLDDFHAVHVSEAIHILLIPSSETKAEIECRCELDELISSVDRRGNLRVRFDDKVNYKKQRTATIRLHYTDLDRLSVSSSARISSDRLIKAPSFSIESSSAGKIELSLEVQDLTLDASSGSKMDLSGTAQRADVDASSGSKISASELAVRELYVDASSGSKIKIMPIDYFKADASSGARVEYAAKAEKMRIEQSSGGKVIKL